MVNVFIGFIIFFVLAIVVSVLVLKPEAITELPEQIRNISRNCSIVNQTFQVEEPYNYTPKYNFLNHQIARSLSSDGTNYYIGRVTLQNIDTFPVNLSVNYTFIITRITTRYNSSIQSRVLQPNQENIFVFVVNISSQETGRAEFKIIVPEIPMATKVNMTNSSEVCT